MPAGSLQFTEAKCYKASAGLDSYTILQPIAAGYGTQSNAQWFCVYLGTNTLRSVGAYNSRSDALDAANKDYQGLPT